MTRPAKIAGEMKAGLDGFRKSIPIIRALRTEGIQNRHITEIRKIIGISTYTGEHENMNTFN